MAPFTLRPLLPKQNHATVWLPFGLLVAAAIVLLGIVTTSLALVNATNQQIHQVSSSQEVRLHAFRLLSTIQDAETGQRGYLLTGNRAYLEPYESARSDVATQLSTMEQALRQDHRPESELAPVRALVAAKIVELDDTIRLRRIGRTAEALDVVNTQQGKQTMDELRARLDDIIVQSNGRVDVHLKDLREATLLQRNVSLGGAVAIILLALTAGLLVLRYTDALKTAHDEVERLNTGLELRVLDRTSELQRANDEIQRFAYIVSHDLRAPLVNVMGFTRELETSLEELKTSLSTAGAVLPSAASAVIDDDIPEALRFIRASTQKMDGLISAILRLSREGGRRMTATRVDLNALLARATAALRHQLDESGASLTIAPNLPTLSSDQMALEQIFGNLLENAIKYLSPARLGKIEVSVTTPDKTTVVIAITDNGRGVAENDLERIFELFRRAGPQNTKGEGIGLAHVRALSRRLGGDVTVDSRLGEGSVFRVILPRVMPSAANGDEGDAA